MTVTLAEAMAGRVRGITAKQVAEQLPRSLQGRFAIKVEGDPFGLRLKARFLCLVPGPRNGQEQHCYLETTVVGGQVKHARIPEEFLALLCVTE